VNAMQNSDEIKKNLIFIEALTEAVGDGGEVPVEEIKEELRADDIDLDASVGKLMKFINICSMDAKRKALDVAAEARKAIEVEHKGQVGKYSAYSKDELLARIKSLMTIPAAELSLAYRHLDGKNQEDLISILEDLEAAKDLESKKNEDHS
jgi:hypothetical protein